IPGDITAPGLGLDDAARATLRAAGPLHVFHAAASLKDTEEALREILAHNVVGTERLLEAVLPLGVATFNHVSTAYVCGRRTGDIDETLDRPRGFNNRYEQSKHYGEHLVVDHCEHHGVPWRLLRPSIVVGHATTAQITGVSGFLGWALKLAALDAAAGGALRTTRLRYVARADAELNLIPVDSVAEDIAGIDAAGAATLGRAFHLTNQTPPTVVDLLGAITDALGLAGVECVAPGAALDPLSARLHRWTRFERPYVAATRRFRRDGDGAYASTRHGRVSLDPVLVGRMVGGVVETWRRQQRDRTAAGASA
ncbi:MAG: SDR family oxidoreductase, partial [Myxococcales bacterium]|nr:SDR family oxidoreductase [Myxococcales bacterium]